MRVSLILPHLLTGKDNRVFNSYLLGKAGSHQCIIAGNYLKLYTQLMQFAIVSGTSFLGGSNRVINPRKIIFVSSSRVKSFSFCHFYMQPPIHGNLRAQFSYCLLTASSLSFRATTLRVAVSAISQTEIDGIEGAFCDSDNFLLVVINLYG